MQYSIPNVSADFMMEIAQILANSPNSMTREELVSSFFNARSSQYFSSGLTAGVNVGLFELDDNSFSCSEDIRNDIKRAHKTQLHIPFRLKLQDFPPFLIYIEFASKGYGSLESAARAKGIFKIKTSAKVIEKSLRLWGVYSELIIYNQKHGTLEVKVDTDKLIAEYVNDLLSALEAELKAKMFIIDNLSPEVYAYLEEKDIKLNELSAALLNYEKEPRLSASRACQTFELFLYKIGQEAGSPVSEGNGLMELSTILRKDNHILKNHLHLCSGIGGMRNITHHGPDKQTGNPWKITPQSSLNTILNIPVLIKSIYKFQKYKFQEL